VHIEDPVTSPDAERGRPIPGYCQENVDLHPVKKAVCRKTCRDGLLEYRFNETLALSKQPQKSRTKPSGSLIESLFRLPAGCVRYLEYYVYVPALWIPTKKGSCDRYPSNFVSSSRQCRENLFLGFFGDRESLFPLNSLSTKCVCHLWNIPSADRKITGS